MPILAEALPSVSTKFVFLSALPFAFSFSAPSPPPPPPPPPFGDALLTSARQQILYMLDQDPHTPLVTSDYEVISQTKTSLSHFFSLFHTHLSQLPSLNTLLHDLTTIDWLCNVLPKMNLMTHFVFHWAHISFNIVTVFQHHNHLQSAFCNLKLRLIEVTSKVFEAVSYGAVIVPPATKLQLLNTWLPYIQKMKPLFDSAPLLNGIGMDEDLCQTIQGAIVSMIVTLPSNAQAHILAAWMESHHLGGYPDLTEAFEIWCYRTKSSKRRLLHRVTTASPTSDLSA